MTGTTKKDHACDGAFSFLPPANQQDFSDDAKLQQALDSQWNTNLEGFTLQAIMGNPWTATNASNQTSYFNPLTTEIPPGTASAAIQWNAFPGRIGYYFPTLSQQDLLSLADTGYQTNGQSFPNITKDPCSGEALDRPYGPYGPRGWQDEYCEWSVRRCPKSKKILRIDMTCENPEYWNSLWMISPDKVLTLYRDTLGKQQIQLDDLYLRDQNGNPVIDPSTGRPAYDPLNKWNRGTVSDDTQGGAMHLTSTPNTLQTEIGLAGSATIQRTVGNSDPDTLICCAQYGQPDRNSDPHIGQISNQLVGLGKKITLTNPPGLYIQKPDFASTGYKTPDGTDPATFWTVVRGAESLPGVTGNLILHATYEVPPDKGYTVSDITIDGAPIEWAGQVIQTILMQINATALPATTPAAEGCVGTPEEPMAQPLQLFHQAVFAGLSTTTIANPVQFPMNLLSNSTLIAPIVAQGATVSMVLTASSVTLGAGGELPTVGFDGADISVKVTGQGTVNYAVPGNSYPDEVTTLSLSVSVSPTARLGLRSILVTNAGQGQGPAMPAMLNVVAAGDCG